jgi:hypothetical protein
MRPVVVEMSASDFDRLWPCGKRSKTGPKTNKLEQTIAAMRDRYEDNRRKLEGLIGKQMEAEFKVSRKTCAKARELLMVEWSAK